MIVTNNRNRVQGGPDVSRRGILHASLGSGMLAALGGMGGLASSASAHAAAERPRSSQLKFVFVNHLTTSPFFVPTQYGIADACLMLGCSYHWTGSPTSVASHMVDAMNEAIAAKVDGIGVSLIDRTAFNEPVARARAAGIPVFAYNADAPGNDRLAYIGQDPFVAGRALGERIAGLVDGGDVAGFIATPGQSNIQLRLDGARAAIKASGKNINLVEIATGHTIEEALARVDSYLLAHTDVKGMVAVDAFSTMAVAKTMEKYGLHNKGVRAGGFDLLAGTLDAIAAGHLDFTIDQEPYLQGFYTVLQMYTFHATGGLARPAETNTGVQFVTKENVASYRPAAERILQRASI